MGRLADGENAGRLAPKQHEDKPTRHWGIAKGGLSVLADGQSNAGRPDGRTRDMIVGGAGPRGLSTPRPAAPRRGASSPFRRLTTAHEELVSYFQLCAVERVSPPSASASDAMTRRAGLRSAFAHVHAHAELMTLRNQSAPKRACLQATREPIATVSLDCSG
jgi:hypothetical protein